MKFLANACVLAVWLAAVPLAGTLAGKADVIGIDVLKRGERTYKIVVTVRHADAGWQHFADRWDVLAPDGRVLATRVLAHPHDDEQPFARALDAVSIPAGIARISVRAHDKRHGYGGRTLEAAVPD